MAAYRAFREPYLVTEPGGGGDFGDFEARRLRYAMLWSFFENNAYRNLHTWSHAYRVQYGLYRYIRNIYNPAYRLGVFWQTHLMGGVLDPEAGDGERMPSALPIETENEALRRSIAELWKWSNWEINKDIFTLRGAVFGDVALEVVDDQERGRVYLRVVNPNLLKDVEVDPFGNVRGYEFEEPRAHPESPNRTVTYRETAERSDDNVIYRTYLNDAPYAWPGQEAVVDGQARQVAEWQQPYGFVPLVVVQHANMGLDWGWSEMHAGRTKFQEVDDLASKLSDQVRKTVDSRWLFTGVSKPASTPSATSRDSETYQGTSAAADRPEPGREEIQAFYASDPAAGAIPLVAPLDIAGTLEYLRDLLGELERDYPELQMDIWTASGDASGRALRVARQRAEAKVQMRRTSYDDGLVRAQQMAVAIGGFRGYEGYQGFGLESYGAGDLDHAIAKRPVFSQDPLDDIELRNEEWKAIGEAVRAGMPLEFYLAEVAGWEPEVVARLAEAMEAQSWRGVERAVAMFPDLGEGDGGGEGDGAEDDGE